LSAAFFTGALEVMEVAATSNLMRFLADSKQQGWQVNLTYTLIESSCRLANNYMMQRDIAFYHELHVVLRSSMMDIGLLFVSCSDNICVLF
jgi:hypothetical protein